MMNNQTPVLQPQPVFHRPLKTFVDELRLELEGDCNFSAEGVALYTSDASNYRQVPLGVIYPKSREDIVLSSRLCQTHQLPLLMRGGGTSQNGQCVNEAVILDCSRYLNRVLNIDTGSKSALVEPGIVCDSLKAEAEKLGLTFGPDPATHSRCTLGGMIGNNSCGPRSMLAGKTVENVLELEILTSEGVRFWAVPVSETELDTIIARGDRQAEIYAELRAIRDEYAELIRERYPTIKRRVSGYNLDQLLPENGFNVARALVGSEGTCVSILQARLRLINNPKYKKLFVLGYRNIFQAGDSVPEIMPHSPIAMEGLDWGIVGGLIDRQLKVREVSLLPEGRAWMLVELAAGTRTELLAKTHAFMNAMQSSSLIESVKRVDDKQTAEAMWSIREQGASATSLSIKPEDIDPIVGWEDTAVDPMQLGDYLRAFQALIDKYDYTTCLYGHFGDGCIHARINFDTRSHYGVAKWRQFSVEVAELVVSFGGSLSGEHGDGQAKAEFLPIMFGPELMQAFRRFKRAWDPDSRMNPGKLIDAYSMHDNLRFGPEYIMQPVETHLQFTEDAQGFSRSTERCIGMGKCRAHKGAMCPSYQATGEERYSTRGRAHLLHELVRGEVLTNGWQSAAIADSMEHCLSCKACKSECPTQVDIAAYKAEFMARHYEGKRRPLYHYAFGHIGTWLPWLSTLARVINPLQRSRAGQTLSRKLLGVSTEKALPTLATQNFRKWLLRQDVISDEHFHWLGHSGNPPVVLWADSINTCYRPHLLISAINVLMQSGFRIAMAKRHFCCGRALYDYGFIDKAKRQATDFLDGLYQHLPENASVVVLEPSCLSVFKDELLRLFSDDNRAQSLASRCLTLADVLLQYDIPVAKNYDHGLIHMHCHGKSLQLASSERRLLEKCIHTISEIEAGCCGMAGVYGMREGTRPIANTLFMRQLKPAIDSADPSTVVISDGFSCSSQIEDHTDRKVLHPVQIVETCLNTGVGD